MANTDYDKVIDKYKDMLQVRKENGDIDINDFLPDINDMIKEDCIWDVFNSFQKELSDEDDLKNMNKLIEMLDDNDDVQNVYHNWEE